MSWLCSLPCHVSPLSCSPWWKGSCGAGMRPSKRRLNNVYNIHNLVSNSCNNPEGCTENSLTSSMYVFQETVTPLRIPQNLFTRVNLRVSTLGWASLPNEAWVVYWHAFCLPTHGVLWCCWVVGVNETSDGPTDRLCWWDRFCSLLFSV